MVNPVLRIEVLREPHSGWSLPPTNSVQSAASAYDRKNGCAQTEPPYAARPRVYSCKRFAAWLKRSPEYGNADEVRRFQLYLIESGASICNRNRIITSMDLFRVTLRRHDLAAEVVAPQGAAEELRRWGA